MWSKPFARKGIATLRSPLDKMNEPVGHPKMKLQTTVKILLLITVLLHSHPAVSISETDKDLQEMQTVTSYSYRSGPGDTRETSRALALFGAQHEAILQSAETLAGGGLLIEYGEKQREIFCLAADELQFRVVDESFSEKNDTYTITIKAAVSLGDFVKAEIRNAALEKEEMQFSLQEEMEPVVPQAIDPAKDLSRAYRYVRKHHWRMAIIYLDHLEKKYPHWGALFYAKAMGFKGMHETERAIASLSLACDLGNQDACIEIEAADPSD
jgi:hypothetical protein